MVQHFPKPSLGGLSEEEFSEMVIRLAHEIRNPLSTIKTAVQLIQHLSQSHGQFAEYYDSIIAQVGRIDQTINDMQRFARLTASHPVDLAVGKIVEEAAWRHRNEARTAGISLVVAGGPPVLVRIDQNNVQTALSELISNALRFSPAGSEVVISWQCDAGTVCLRIDDAGPGINPDHQDRIMRPFFSTSTQGTGLGLNIVDKICRLACGQLTWENLDGHGSRFAITLPRRDSAAAEPAPAAARPPFSNST